MDASGLAVQMLQSAKMDPPEIYLAKFQSAIDTIRQQTQKAVANQVNGQIMTLDQKIKKLCVASKNVVIHYINDGEAVREVDEGDDPYRSPRVEFDSDQELDEFETLIERMANIIEEEFGITFPEIYDKD